MGYHHEERLFPCVLLDEGSRISHEGIHPFRVIRRKRRLVLDWIPIGTMSVSIAARFPRVLIGNVITRLIETTHGAAPFSKMSGDVIPT